MSYRPETSRAPRPRRGTRHRDGRARVLAAEESRPVAGIVLVAGALAASARAAIVMLADVPFATAEMIAALAERHRRDAAPLVVSWLREALDDLDVPDDYDRALARLAAR